MAGFLVTLADQKAVLFYLGFLPAFVDLSQRNLADTAVVIAITVLAVGGVKLGYAALVDRARSFVREGRGRVLSSMAAFIMIAVELIVIAST